MQSPRLRRAGTRRSPNWSAGPLRYARRPSRNWPRSRRARARSWRRCTGTAPPRNWPTSSRCRCAGCGLFCDRTGNPRGPPKPVPRLRRRRPQRRHRPLNWGRRPGIRGRAATGPPGRRRLQDPTQNRTRGHRPGIVRRGTRVAPTGGGHGVAPTGGGPALPVRAERIGAAWRRALPVLRHRRSSRPPRRHRQRARRRPRRCRPVSSPRSSAVGPGSSSGSGHASA